MWREVCFSLPAVRALAAAGQAISILCPEPQRRFWEAAGFDALITYPVGASVRAIGPLVEDASRALLWEAGPAADACAKAGIGERIGLPARKLAKRLTHSLNYTVKAGPPEHHVTRFLEVVKLLGADPMKAEHFAPIECAKSNASLLLIPESDDASNHEWPADRWVEVINGMKDSGRDFRVGLIRQNSHGQDIATRTESETVALDPGDPASFNGYPNLLAADGSLPHLAAAFGATCAVLFGPADPDLTRPLGKQHLIIRRKVECSPCFLKKCPIDLRCQNDLDVARVIDRLKSLSPA
jgi:ADP-heptose:LPS heptosyltransferase